MSDRDSLKDAVYRTLQSIDNWEAVLQVLCEITGAGRGSITLRDRATAQVVIPERMALGPAHPLIYGWQLPDVQSYLEEYHEQDVWIDVARQHHPSIPYAMSEHLDLHALKQTPFWTWLEQIEISDTVICDIGPATQRWVAINLFFRIEESDVRNKCISVLTEFKEYFQEAWRYGQQVRLQQHSSDHLEVLLELQPHAAVLLDQDNQIVAKNKAAGCLMSQADFPFSIEDDLLVTSNKSARLGVDELAGMAGHPGNSGSNSGGSALSENNVTLQIHQLDRVDDTTGENSGLQLLTFKRNSGLKPQNLSPVWDNPALTKREAELVMFLAKGGRISDFVREKELNKSTGHFHWQNVKRKLGITDRAELIAQYHVYLREKNSPD